jgi:hypothetical protein
MAEAKPAVTVAATKPAVAMTAAADATKSA